MQSSDLLPGVCDFHVHVGEKIGGYRLRDDFRALDKLTGRGLAAIGAFVTEEPDTALRLKLHRMQRDAAENFRGHVHWHLTPVQSSPDEVIPLLGAGSDLKFYTTYRDAGLYSSYERLADWMRELSGLKTRILVHCEDDTLIEQNSRRHPFKTPFSHSLRRPEAAEVAAVERVLDLAVKHDHPVHVVHVSTPRAAQLIRAAKSANPAITCETAPHYLLCNDQLLKTDNAHRWLCSPPYRCEASRGLLVELLQDGFFDIIASDHCPFTLADKDRHRDTPAKVPNGIPGLDNLFPSLYGRLVQTGVISLELLVELCCLKPAALMGIEAVPAFTIEQLVQPPKLEQP